jgi:hypothetical protein
VYLVEMCHVENHVHSSQNVLHEEGDYVRSHDGKWVRDHFEHLIKPKSPIRHLQVQPVKVNWEVAVQVI